MPTQFNINPDAIDIDLYKTTYLMSICKTNLDTLEQILKRNLLDIKDLQFSNKGGNMIDYLIQNPDLSIYYVKMLFESCKFSSTVKALIESAECDMLFECARAKKYDIVSYILSTIQSDQWFSKTNNDNHETVLTLAIQDKKESIVEYILNKYSSLDINKVCQPYINLIHLAMYSDETIAIMLLNSKYYENIKDVKYPNPENQTYTISCFSLANVLNLDKFALTYMKTIYFKQYDVNNNAVYIYNLLDYDAFKCLIDNKYISQDNIIEKDNDGNNIIGLSLKNKNKLHKDKLHKYIQDNDSITLDMIKQVNKLGDNLMIMAARYDFEFLLYLYTKCDILKLTFHRNYRDNDFVDVLMFEADTDYPFMLNMVDTDDFEKVMDKYYNCKTMNMQDWITVRYYVNEKILFRTKNTIVDSDVDNDSDTECMICMNGVECVEYNCNHKVCFKCSMSIVECPLCRCKISKRSFLNNK